MSKIIKETNYRELSHIVEFDDNYYYVDSNHTPDHSYETMVFEWDIEKDDVLSWTELYCKRYSSYEEMKKNHYHICENLKKILEENKDYESDITFGDFVVCLLDSINKKESE